MIKKILEFAVQSGCSDVHIRSGRRVYVRKNNRLVPLKSNDLLNEGNISGFIDQYMPAHVKETFFDNLDGDFGLYLKNIGRFRINAYFEQGKMALAIRIIKLKIPRIESLNLPRVLLKLTEYKNGIILVTGSTGSGKSTTMASLLDYINHKSAKHIITIEDPIEYVFQEKKSIIHQREIGIDVKSFNRGLRAALREDPDIILIGEMRDKETIEAALNAAETGHLVISTLHTVDVKETINRTILPFPPFQQNEIRIQLASVLRSVVCMRLLPSSKKEIGRIPACEVMINTSAVKELLKDEVKIAELPDLLEKGYEHYGMQTFDRSLLDLYNKNLIDYDTAIENATNPADLRLKIQGIT